MTHSTLRTLALGAIGSLALAASSSAVVLPNNLLAYYPFDTDGSDASGNAPDSTLVGGAVIGAGNVGGGALQLFDAAGNLANAAAIVGTGTHFDSAAAADTMTVTFWAFNQANANSSAYWINSPAATTSNFRGSQVHAPWGNGTVFFDSAGCCTATTQRISSAATAAATGVWQHWTVIKNGGAKQIYINGVLEPNLNQAAGADAFLPFDGQLTVGAEFRPVGTDPVNSMNALIDDFAVFDVVLTPSEIAQLAGGATAASLIPEPSGTLLSVLGLGLLAARRRRK